MRKLMIRVYCSLNIPKHVSRHLFGAHHRPTHRMTVGGLLMIFGITLCRTVEHSTYMPFPVFIGVDAFGFFLHGVGAIPFAEQMYILSQAQQTTDNKK